MGVYTFPRSVRLTKPEQFTRVYREGRRLSAGPLQIIIMPSPEGQARLGLAIAKRVLPRSVDRNATKRAIRESFRRYAPQLDDLDCVVTLRGRKSLGLPADLAKNLDILWLRLAKP
ncbi:MAG: ribonuclease P protein component [Oceanococcus sp.]